MPFLPAIITAAIIGGGATLGASAIATRGKGKNDQYARALMRQRELLARERTLASQEGRRYANELRPFVLDYLKEAPEAFEQTLGTYGEALDAYRLPAQYYSGLMRGDRAQISNLLAPEMQSILRNYQTALTSSRELTPRSGASATIAGELPFRAAGDISNLISAVRPMAAGGLVEAAGGIADVAGGYGTTAANMGSLAQGLSGVMGNLWANAGQQGGQSSDLLTYGLGRQQQNLNTLGSVGGWLFDTFKGVDWGSIFSPKTGQEQGGLDWMKSPEYDAVSSRSQTGGGTGGVNTADTDWI